ncbi:MAG: DUF3577 domain-containing protein [Woeseiaceae bacterium]|nr:DUF3577 domain-containing protein [Woeseiaceae bacterium]
MNSNENAKYFDLHTTGIGYLNRVREVTPEQGTPFLAVTVAAIHGKVADVEHTYFECAVYGKAALATVRSLKTAVDSGSKVLIGFTLSNLKAEAFTFKQGEKAGQLGVNLKARLIKVGWAKVDGEKVPIEESRAA